MVAILDSNKVLGYLEERLSLEYTSQGLDPFAEDLEDLHLEWDGVSCSASVAPDVDSKLPFAVTCKMLGLSSLTLCENARDFLLPFNISRVDQF